MLETTVIDGLVDITMDEEITPATAVGSGVNVVGAVLTVKKYKS